MRMSFIVEDVAKNTYNFLDMTYSQQIKPPPFYSFHNKSLWKSVGFLLRPLIDGERVVTIRL